LINMEIEPFLLASSIIGVLGIRLIRTNCPHCSEPDEPEPALLKLIGEEIPADARFQRGRGCSACMHTGFHGRTALTELLEVNEVFRDSVLLKLPTRQLQRVAIEQGLVTMWQNGVRRAMTGQTTLEEVLRVVTVDQM